jgi:hypothetical protein
MNRIAKIGTVALLATGLSVAAFAAIKTDHKGPTAEQRKEFLEKRISKLPAEEQRLARELFPLRDSLMRVMGDYQRKARKDSTAPRSLTAERTAIASLEAQIQRLQASNQEVWLDLLAHTPGPGGPGFARHHGRHGKGGPDCPPPGEPKDGPDDDGPDDLPPPPPPPPAP